MGQEVQLYSQFVSQKIRKIRWFSDDGFSASSSATTSTFLTGSWDDNFKNSVTAYNIENKSDDFNNDDMAMDDPSAVEKCFRFVEDARIMIPGDVTDIRILSEGRFLVANSKGDLRVLDYYYSDEVDSEDKKGNFRQLCLLEKLHNIGSLPCSCTSVSASGLEAVTGGEDGRLTRIDLRKGVEIQNTNRKEDSTSSSGIYCIRHYTKDQVMFHPVYPENLFTCSDDGLLLHWDASALRQGSLRSVEESHQLSPWMLGEALADKVNLTNLNSEQILSINSIDIVNNWVICGTDIETVDLVTDLVVK